MRTPSGMLYMPPPRTDQYLHFNTHERARARTHARTHAPPPPTRVAVPDRLMVLRRRKRHRRLAVHQRKERRLLPIKELLHNHLVACRVEAAAAV